MNMGECVVLASQLTIFWRFPKPISFPNVLESDVILGEETSVSDENFLVDDMCQGYTAEHLGKKLSHVFGVLRADFTLEPVHSIHGVAFVIP